MRYPIYLVLLLLLTSVCEAQTPALLSFLSGSTEAPAPNYPEPTVAWYKFEETSGDAIDEINAYNGTVSGPTRDGIRYDFDGTNDFVDINPALADMEAVGVGTISFRVKPPVAAPGATQTMLSFNRTSGGGTSFGIGYNQFLGGRLRIRFTHAFGDKWIIDTSNNITTNDTEVLITIVHDGVEPVVYINGLLVAQAFTNSTDITWWLDDSAANLEGITVGALNESGTKSQFYDGGVRDIKLWDIALTEQEVRAVAGLPTNEELGLYADNVTVGDGSANIFVKLPSDLDPAPAGGWPLIVWFGGDGTSGSTTTKVAGQAMSTGDDLTYTHTISLPSGVNSNYRLMSTVVIKVDGEPVGKGSIGGTITGTGISSGSITNLETPDAPNVVNPEVSVTFSTAQTGKVVTYDYTISTMFLEGIPKWVNVGDNLDDRVIFIAIQNVQSTTDFDIDYFDKAVEYAWNNYTINRNRISMAGISRGGRGILDAPGVIKTRYQFWIDETTGVVYAASGAGRVESGMASVVVGTATYGTHTAINYTDIGIAAVHGTGDGVLTNTTYTFSASLSANNEPPYISNILGAAHNASVWDTECYNRQFRVGGTGTAKWDWLDFILRYSKNAEERATLFVEQVEKRRYNTEKDIIDYRHAARQVAALSAGATKTALEGRLTTVKSAIDGAGTRWVLNPHSSGNDETGNYVNLGTATSGTTYSNIVNFDGGASTLDFVYTTASGGSNAAITSSRRSHTGGFSKIANNSGVLASSTEGTFGFTDVPAGTYTMRVYHNEGTGNYTNNATLEVTVGFTPKTQFSAINSLLGFIEFTGIPHADLAAFNINRNNDRDTYVTLIELYKNP